MGTQVLEKIVEQAKKRLTASIEIEALPIEGYEQVLKVTDETAGLTAIIAIHNTSLGPALGGIRIQPYKTFDEALDDVLRLSKGMTHKSAISEVGFGGGKSVIIADPKTQKTEALLLAFGAAVESLGGKYICAEDVGCTTQDVKIIRRATKYVVGLEHAKSSGDPGPFTAWGVFRGIQATLMKLFGSPSPEGRTIAIQGLGNVGLPLADFLFWNGANLILSDIDPARLARVAAKYGAKTVSADQILSVECDILAPCALGGILNDQTIPQLRCKGVAGSSNNQLLRSHHAKALFDRGIVYAPDFVINAGGLLNVSAELEENGYLPTSAHQKIHRIYDTILAIYEISERGGESSDSAAISLAEYRIRYGIGKRIAPPTFHHNTH